MDELEPRSFSFNSPYGACPECTGIGTRLEVDPELIVPDDEKSLGEGAVAPWASGTSSSEYFQRLLQALADDMSVSMDTPWRKLPGTAPRTPCCTASTTRCTSSTGTATAGCAATTPASRASIPFVQRRHAETESDWSRDRYEGYMREVPCPACGGARLKPESLAVLVGGRSIADVCRLPIRECDDVPAQRRL